MLMRKKMGERAFADLSKRVLARMEKRLGLSPVEFRMTALLVVGTRKAEPNPASRALQGHRRRTGGLTTVGVASARDMRAALHATETRPRYAGRS